MPLFKLLEIKLYEFYIFFTVTLANNKLEEYKCDANLALHIKLGIKFLYIFKLNTCCNKLYSKVLQ